MKFKKRLSQTLGQSQVTVAARLSQLVDADCCSVFQANLGPKLFHIPIGKRYFLSQIQMDISLMLSFKKVGKNPPRNDDFRVIFLKVMLCYKNIDSFMFFQC